MSPVTYTHVVGTTAVLSVIPVDEDGIAYDPPTLIFQARNPAEAVAADWAYPTSPQIVKDSPTHYHVDLPLTLPGEWDYHFKWGPGIGTQTGTINVQADAYDQTAIPTLTYTTIAAVRDELGDSTELDDREIARLILQAEDLIDEDLGARRIDETTGRKVVEADVEAWQFLKLSRATTKLAALLIRTPDTLSQQFSEVTGPDFSFKGPIGSRFGSTIDPLLNQSGLRRLTTIASGGRRRPTWHAFAINDDSECP